MGIGTSVANAPYFESAFHQQASTLQPGWDGDPSAVLDPDINDLHTEDKNEVTPPSKVQGSAAPQPVGEYKGAYSDEKFHQEGWDKLPNDGGWSMILGDTYHKGDYEGFMKTRPDDEEGVTMPRQGDQPGSSLLWLRKKPDPSLSVPMSSMQDLIHRVADNESTVRQLRNPANDNFAVGDDRRPYNPRDPSMIGSHEADAAIDAAWRKMGQDYNRADQIVDTIGNLQRGEPNEVDNFRIKKLTEEHNQLFPGINVQNEVNAREAKRLWQSLEADQNSVLHGERDQKLLPPPEPEKVGKAALQYKDQIFEGQNHGMALNDIMEKYPDDEFRIGTKPGQIRDGFMTTKGRFVSREEAMTIARAQDQLEPNAKKAVEASDSSMLLSEDLSPTP